MKRFPDRRFRPLVPTGLMVVSSGCAPTVDVAGVYFPGWLVSVVAGVATSYGCVLWLSRHSQTRSLADSGILFLSLAVGIALAVWLVAFSAF